LAAAAGPKASRSRTRSNTAISPRRFSSDLRRAFLSRSAVDAYTGEIRIRRMLAVCAAGRILNPLTARSQVIGGMTMGAGAALMEELAVDKALGFFVNHDLAGYEVPVHADIPHQEVIFLDETDPMSSPMKAKGIGELGICGVGRPGDRQRRLQRHGRPRVRDYPITLDKPIWGPSPKRTTPPRNGPAWCSACGATAPTSTTIRPSRSRIT
jgi:xanthine dehydrogenase YagR molybdenum-binding subunit